MKVCITSQGSALDSAIDPRFGRCEYFVFADTETLAFEALPNPNLESMGGAGIQSAQLVASKGAKAVITGNVGPNAFKTLQAAGIKIYVGASGSIKEAIDKYLKGELKEASNPTAVSKAGMPGKNI